MLFPPIEHQLQRRVRQLRELRADDPLRVWRELAAEPAAHVLRDHADIGLRNAERLRESLRALMAALRRHPCRELVAFPLAYRAVRLETHVADDVRRVCLFDDVGGLLEPAIEIAGFLPRAGTRVGL